jgi:hypothetical protein
MSRKPDEEFIAASHEPRTSLARELLDLLRNNKRWWLTPIVITILLLGLVSLMAGTAVAPFIYTLF